ncbi:MAG: D-cysteine desulfhydrase [Myxococcota bacterium]|jgi:D-cysteine desulfhydrase
MKYAEKISLAHLPTPVQPLPRWYDTLGVRLTVKRDDLTGSHLSGNKIRKLEYLLREAVDLGATHVITTGGIQSNHCRATALAAASLGMEPVLLLRTPRGLQGDLPSTPTGNVLLFHVAGATIHTCDPHTYRTSRTERMAELAAAIRADGGNPYVVDEGGSNALGTLGYVEAAKELLDQLDAPPDTVVVPTGSGGTLAGLALGFKALGVATKAVGIAVCDDADYFEAIVLRIAEEAAARFGLPTLTRDDFTILEGFQGIGYAKTTPEEMRFLTDVARKDGLVLDPVYTNKALRGLYHTLRDSPGCFGEDVVFVHTGGVFGLMAAGDSVTGLATSGVSRL